MKILHHIIVVVLFASSQVVRSEEIDQNLIDYYVDYISKHTEDALRYEPPKDARMYEAQDERLLEFGEFDFIIVGGGSTGCVIANRLSEISEWKILLLEAGSYRDENLSGIPSLWVQDALTKFNWGFETIPQKYGCLGSTGQRCGVPRGKGIGGTSLINTLIYSRASSSDYDSWSILLDDPSWNYESILHYFKKSENFTRTNFDVPLDEDYHGYNGSLHMTQSSPKQEIASTFLDASRELGYNITDYNGKNLIGTSVAQLYIKDAKRFDPEMAFISTAKDRKNLVVLPMSYVTKIKISRRYRSVTGVIFTRSNHTYIARSRKEVILSAGSISSPQLLMLSGIGPQDHLKSLGIPIIQSLPVGEILYEHPLAPVVFSSDLNNGYVPIEDSIKYYLKGQGSLTRSNYIETLGFYKTSADSEQTFPDVEFIFNNYSGSGVAQKLFKWSDETFSVIDANVPNPFVIQITLLHSKSTGTIKLKSVDPFDYPLIDLNILSKTEDVETLYQGVLIALSFLETESFRRSNVKLAFDQFPGCNHTEPLSKEYWYCYLRIVTSTTFHPISTCLIGRTPETGVVDKNLKVFGVKRLRVADASIFPFPLSGHPNSVCTAIGEKVSDMIKEEWLSTNPV